MSTLFHYAMFHEKVQAPNTRREESIDIRTNMLVSETAPSLTPETTPRYSIMEQHSQPEECNINIDNRELDQITDDNDESSVTHQNKITPVSIRPHPRPITTVSFKTKAKTNLQTMMQICVLLMFLPLLCVMYIPLGVLLCFCYKRKTDEYTIFQLICCWPVVIFNPGG
ncbi:developmentally-regulated membrane protein [Acrasis kona]|uniref:Developmentally-regulated membrane protein n=1 Tax=Acrasis kona TaxID=1008807 RepID=A0AAW2Z878_9EUKA